jgi:kynurenine formamidase
MDDWAVIIPAMLEAAPVEIRDADILIIHTGWQRYWEGQKQRDLVRYFCMHPGGKIELLEWMLKKKIKWFGRFIMGAFPWRYEGLEACPCRIVCFSDCGNRVEAVGHVAKAHLARRR